MEPPRVLQLTSLSVKSMRLDFSSSSRFSPHDCSSSLSPSSLKTFTSSVLPKSSPGDEGAADEAVPAPTLWFVCGILVLIAPLLLTVTFDNLSDVTPGGDNWCLTAIAVDIRSALSTLYTLNSLEMRFINSNFSFRSFRNFSSTFFYFLFLEILRLDQRIFYRFFRTSLHNIFSLFWFSFLKSTQFTSWKWKQ